jgi:hypothetical protein
MAHVGEIIEHPHTGERITFLETSATTPGASRYPVFYNWS